MDDCERRTTNGATNVICQRFIILLNLVNCFRRKEEKNRHKNWCLHSSRLNTPLETDCNFPSFGSCSPTKSIVMRQWKKDKKKQLRLECTNDIIRLRLTANFSFAYYWSYGYLLGDVIVDAIQVLASYTKYRFTIYRKPVDAHTHERQANDRVSYSFQKLMLFVLNSKIVLLCSVCARTMLQLIPERNKHTSLQWAHCQ